MVRLDSRDPDFAGAFARLLTAKREIAEDVDEAVRAIIADGCEKARRMAQETMRDVREVMGLSYN